MNSDDIQKIIDTLTQNLGPAGQHVFDLAVRQVLIQGWLMVIVFVVSILFIILTSKSFAQDWPRNEIENKGTIVFIFAFVPLCLSVMGLVTSGLTDILNPEWAAVQLILAAIK